MKVTINGYEIECTPEEFQKLMDIFGQGSTGQSVDEFRKLPDSIEIGPTNPYKLPDDYDRWIKHPDVVALYGCTVSNDISVTPLTGSYTEAVTPAVKEYSEMDRREAFRKRKELREARRNKDFPPYLDCPKPEQE
jgi:hypothetical protein